MQNLKSDSHLPNKILLICFNENPLKMMKNTFYFILKTLFFSRYLSFFPTFWSYKKNGLIRKTRFTSQFMTLQLGLQTIAIQYCQISHKVNVTIR